MYKHKNETLAGFKVFTDTGTERVVGVHLNIEEAHELIGLFATVLGKLVFLPAFGLRSITLLKHVS